MKVPRVTRRGMTTALIAVFLGMNCVSLAIPLLGSNLPGIPTLRFLAGRTAVYALLLVLHLLGMRGSGHAFVLASVVFTSLAISAPMFASGYPLGLALPVIATAIVADWKVILAGGLALIALVALRLGIGIFIANPLSSLVFLIYVFGVAGLWLLFENSRLEAARRADELSEASAKVRFQSFILDHVGQIVVAGDMRDRITYWNEAASRAHGWSAAEVLAMETGPLLVEMDAAELRRLDALVASGRSY